MNIRQPTRENPDLVKISSGSTPEGLTKWMMTQLGQRLSVKPDILRPGMRISKGAGIGKFDKLACTNSEVSECLVECINSGRIDNISQDFITYELPLSLFVTVPHFRAVDWKNPVNQYISYTHSKGANRAPQVFRHYSDICPSTNLLSQKKGPLLHLESLARYNKLTFLFMGGLLLWTPGEPLPRFDMLTEDWIQLTNKNYKK